MEGLLQMCWSRINIAWVYTAPDYYYWIARTIITISIIQATQSAKILKLMVFLDVVQVWIKRMFKVVAIRFNEEHFDSFMAKKHVSWFWQLEIMIFHGYLTLFVLLIFLSEWIFSIYLQCIKLCESYHKDKSDFTIMYLHSHKNQIAWNFVRISPKRGLNLFNWLFKWLKNHDPFLDQSLHLAPYPLNGFTLSFLTERPTIYVRLASLAHFVGTVFWSVLLLLFPHLAIKPELPG